MAMMFLLALLGSSCSVGHGQGDIAGTVSVPGCRNGPYDLGPSVFFGEAIEQLLKIRVQRGSDLEVKSDGLAVLVTDATLVKREFLDKDIDIAGTEPRVDVTLYLNESCPPGRDKTPVVLPAASGVIRFESIYAPQDDDDEVQITATLSDMHFEDPRNPERTATISGSFDFLYVRGSPAQRFP
jgi:hypothetical protein